MITLVTRLLMAALMLFGFTTAAMQFFESNSEYGDFGYVIANGELTDKDAANLRRLLERRARNGKPTAIMLTSHGGTLESIARIGRVIVESSNLLCDRYRRRNIIVINEECSSACAALTTWLTYNHNPETLEFMVSPTARFGFHSPVDKSETGVRAIRDYQEREDAIARQIRFFRENGIDLDWIENNIQVFRQSKMKTFTAKQLCETASKVIPSDSCLDESLDDVIPVLEAEFGVISFNDTCTPPSSPQWLKAMPLTSDDFPASQKPSKPKFRPRLTRR